jgi:hypothetical protein
MEWQRRRACRDGRRDGSRKSGRDVTDLRQSVVNDVNRGRDQLIPMRCEWRSGPSPTPSSHTLVRQVVSPPLCERGSQVLKQVLWQ